MGCARNSGACKIYLGEIDDFCVFIAEIVCLLLLSSAFVRLLIMKRKSLNRESLNTGSGSIGIYRWNSSTQGELVISSYHVHY